MENKKKNPVASIILTLIEQRTGVNTLTVQNAVNVVAVGTGKYAEIMARMEE